MRLVVADLGADLGQGWYLGRPAARPVRLERRLVLDAKAGRAHATAPEVNGGALASVTSGVLISVDAEPLSPIPGTGASKDTTG